jgi:hypothetical protein
MFRTTHLTLLTALLTLAPVAFAAQQSNPIPQIDTAELAVDLNRGCNIPFAEPDVAPLQVAPAASPPPIYIGGVRYLLTQEHMTATYQKIYIFNPCGNRPPIMYDQFTGYTANIPVDGDFSQPLMFDISGRASEDMSLAISCGSFSGQDSGNKFVVFKQQQTNGSCQTMQLTLTSHNPPKGILFVAPTVQLNITVAEQLP